MLHVPACTPGTVSSSGAPCASTSPSQPPTPIPPLHWLTTNSARRAGRNRWQTAPLARTVARPRRHARLAPATASARPGRARAHAMAAIAAPAPARASRAPVRARPGPPASFCPRVMALAHCVILGVCAQSARKTPSALPVRRRAPRARWAAAASLDPAAAAAMRATLSPVASAQVRSVEIRPCAHALA